LLIREELRRFSAARSSLTLDLNPFEVSLLVLLVLLKVTSADSLCLAVLVLSPFVIFIPPNPALLFNFDKLFVA
jgi:hypothetical protein